MQQAKFWMIGALFALFSSAASALSVHDAVQATANLKVRAAPNLSGSELATMPSGAKGSLLSGPTTQDGYIWWLVSWKGGPAGYSAERTVNGSEVYMVFVPVENTVYHDDLGLGWYENVWPNTTSNPFSTPSRVGTYSIATTTTAAWARLYLATNGFNTTGYHSLRFSVRSENQVGQLYVALYNTSGVPFHYVPVNAYVGGGVINPNTWYDVRILLSGENELNAVNANVGGFVVESAVPATFRLDDVTIDTVIGSTKWIPPAPPPPQTSQAGSIVYGEEAGWGWDVGSWTNTAINPASPLAYTGSNGIEVRTTAQWGRLQLLVEPNFKFNTGGYDTLSFFLNIGKRENADLHVGLLNANGVVINNDYVALNDPAYVEYGAFPEHEWKYVRIPLSHLSAVNTDVYGVEIQSSNAGTFHVDIVRFETNGGCQP